MYNDVVGGTRNNIPSEEILPGINFRMGELPGAVALVQIQRLDDLLAAMRQNKATLMASMADVAHERGISFRAMPDPQGDAAISLIFFAPTATRPTRSRMPCGRRASARPCFITQTAATIISIGTGRRFEQAHLVGTGWTVALASA